MAASCALGSPSSPVAHLPKVSLTAATNQAVRKALLDYAQAQACNKLIGHFEALDGPAHSGTTKAHEGRWWIRQCRTHVENGAIVVNLRGPLWLWVDQKSSGFELAQYVVFVVDVTVKGTVDAGYDAVNQVALLWFTPTDPSKVAGRPVGHARPRAEGLGIMLNTITLGSAQQIADASARESLARDLPRALRERFNRGFTIEIDFKTERVNGTFGRMATATATTTAAERPFPMQPDTILNERQVLRLSPFGYQVAGPIEPLPRARLELEMEQGEGIRFRTACAAEVDAWFSPIEHGGWPEVVAPHGDEGGDVRARSTTRVIRPPPCRFYLITRALSGTAQVAIRLSRPDQSSAPKDDVATTRQKAPP